METEEERWCRKYKNICENLKINCADDYTSFSILRSKCKFEDVVIKKLELFRGKDFKIIGGAKKGISLNVGKNSVVLVADSGIENLSNIVPDIIVTDLDGENERIKMCVKSGSIPVVHAHGDNMNKIKNEKNIFEGYFFPTGQSCQIPKKNNLFGFTDGDRAVLLADRLEASSIELLCFDFENPSDKGNRELKKKKLEISKEIINEISMKRTGKTIEKNGFIF
ncbi:6-hydroxymethylpterin diphosphokinase MptE-like protein [Caldiplasma sukawensis]